LNTEIKKAMSNDDILISNALVVQVLIVRLARLQILDQGNAKHGIDATLIRATGQVEETLNAPLIAPAVLDDPVLLGPANQQYSVVHICWTFAGEGFLEIYQIGRSGIDCDG